MISRLYGENKSEFVSGPSAVGTRYKLTFIGENFIKSKDFLSGVFTSLRNEDQRYSKFRYFYLIQKFQFVLNLTFLGTGTSQGVPIIGCHCNVCSSQDSLDKRLRSSVLIRNESLSLVIDAGPDFRYQMLRESVDSLDAILLTHEHRDHIAGLDDVRAFNYIQKRAMDIFAEDRVLKEVREQFLYAFEEDKYPGVPNIKLNLIDENIFSIQGLSILPIRAMHYTLPILGFRIGDITYITDASFISESEKKKFSDTKILIINALRKEEHVTHFNLKQALHLIEEISPEKAILTHVSHQMGRHSEVQRELPDNVQLAYDGLQLEMD